MNIENAIVELIVNAGESKTNAFEALNYALENDFSKASEMLEESRKVGLKAHDAHMDLLKYDADGGKFPSQLLLIHSQDHLMGSILSRELIAEIINLQKEIKNLKDEIEILKQK